jgi:hypothetical protein
VDEFQTQMLEVSVGGGGAETRLLEPVPFGSRVSETQLERWIVERPSVIGEELLVLGQQLHEFEEDLDRLDILAVDRTGDVVLIELKVNEAFRVTDLQALAYAGAYAGRSTDMFARTLQRALERRGEEESTVNRAQELIAEFVQVDSFDDWVPSEHIRVKLIAPGFPKRVLKTVKWLGDIYGVRLEAIQVRLYEDDQGAPPMTRYFLSFERLLPLPGDDAFDLTVREREGRRRAQSVSQRRPDLIPLMLEHGLLEDGQELWIAPSGLPVGARHLFNASDPDRIFRVEVDAAEGKFRWQPAPDEQPVLISPSRVPYELLRRIAPGVAARRYRSVGRRYTFEPGGQTILDVAIENGIWSSNTDAIGDDAEGSE